MSSLWPGPSLIASLKSRIMASDMNVLKAVRFLNVFIEVSVVFMVATSCLLVQAHWLLRIFGVCVGEKDTTKLLRLLMSQ